MIKIDMIEFNYHQIQVNGNIIRKKLRNVEVSFTVFKSGNEGKVVLGGETYLKAETIEELEALVIAEFTKSIGVNSGH